MNIAAYIDHTLLKPTTTHIEIKKICEEALDHQFAAVCVPPPMVITAKSLLSGAAVPKTKLPADPATTGSQSASSASNRAIASKVEVATVIGFPFGYSVVKAKLAETEQAILDGADELDVVINLIALKDENWSYLEDEMQSITGLAHAHGKLVKVIIESGILTDAEIIRCCDIYCKLGVDFLKTSTGYAEKGASLHAVQLLRKHLPSSIRVKASGGIRDYAFASQLIAAGADRLGCSASVAIVRGQ
jgi:deoxyribose-phosphate aldolase